MAALPTDLRNVLENTVKQARVEAEKGARQALEALAVGQHEPHGSMSLEAKKLRNRLRAHGRQLGDVLDARRGTQTTHRLMREVAYEQWHRMLFARFLAENHLLIHPEHGVAVSLEECEDLARGAGSDPWVLAASFAQAMLPQIFRADDPALLVTLPPETRVALQKLLVSLPARVFTEDDALGWTYQFWQSAEKDSVNARAKSGEKITGETLPAVTQLFTEPYMVHFLLDNTLGAWHAGKVLTEAERTQATSEAELREAVRLHGSEGYDFEYLRFVREPVAGDDGEDEQSEPTGPWRPAAGTFGGWPREAKEVTVLDPCCGSGHFLVSAFRLLVPLRMAEEGLSAADAARAVIRDNLFGLELDARCTQIAAFNLALAAWKVTGGHIELPPLRIACSGIGPQATKNEWLKLAEEAAAAGGMPGEKNLFGSEETLLSAGVKGGLETLYDLFQRAPDLGSLIDVRGRASGSAQVDALQADFEELAPLMDAILSREGASAEEVERAVAAKGMAEAARILAGPQAGYTLVITNVPYLGRGSHTDEFKTWADMHYREARNDLATIFLVRMLRWAGSGKNAGTIAAVTPQNWLFLTSYRKLRERLLKKRTWDIVARLGPKGFRTPMWDFNIMLLVLSGTGPTAEHLMCGVDAMAAGIPADKASLLRGESLESPGADRLSNLSPCSEAGEDEDQEGSGPADGSMRVIPQKAQLENPDARVALRKAKALPLLSKFARSHQGTTTGDNPRYIRAHWEVLPLGARWEWFQTRTSDGNPWSGRHQIILYEEGLGELADSPAARIQGHAAFGHGGVVVGQMASLPASRYSGEMFDMNSAAVVPHNPAHLPAIWAFGSSPEFSKAVRRIDQKLNVTSATLVKVPFDLDHWQTVADEQYPGDLPEPYSDDPTQWLFHGHPAHSDPGTEVHVAMARLLGYRWPAESDPKMRLSDEARELIRRAAELDALGHADKDGIVCLSPVRGEGSAADRLRALLGAAFGDDFSAAREREILAATAEAKHGTGKVARNMDAWLRDSFFEEHCKLFQHRPFIWHIWDGQRDGFNALVHYHRLAGEGGTGRRTLETLTYTYLGDWIDRQRKAQEIGEEGADARLAAALRLQSELRSILEGEPPYDLFVRWKPLREQPLGWDPDVNDGVLLNIRPFMLADDLGRKGAGVLRWKPTNIKWTRDGGKERPELRPREQYPWFWGCDPDKQAGHRIDFGAETPNAAPAGTEFGGVRWNGLHYTRAAKAAARTRAGEKR